MEITDYSLPCVFFLEKELLVDQRSPLILKQHIPMLIKHVHAYPFLILPAQLAVLIHLPSLHVLALFFLAAGVELVPQKLEVRLLLLLHLQTNPGVHLVLADVAE